MDVIDALILGWQEALLTGTRLMRIYSRCDG